MQINLGDLGKKVYKKRKNQKERCEIWLINRVSEKRRNPYAIVLLVVIIISTIHIVWYCHCIRSFPLRLGEYAPVKHYLPTSMGMHRPYEHYTGYIKSGASARARVYMSSPIRPGARAEVDDRNNESEPAPSATTRKLDVCVGY